MKTETKIRKLKLKAYRVAKAILAKHNVSYRKNEIGQFEAFNAGSHEFHSFRLNFINRNDSDIELFVSVKVGRKKTGHAVLDLLDQSSREHAIFTIGNSGGITLWNAAKKNGERSLTAPKGFKNAVFHRKL